MTNPYDSQQPEKDATPDVGNYQAPSSEPTDFAATSSTPYGSYNSGAAGYAGTSGNSGWATADERKNAVAPWALGVGIFAILAGVSIIGSGLSFVPGLIGLILGIIAVVKGRGIQGPGRRMGMSVTSIILSILAILATIAFWLIATYVMNETGMADCMSIQDPAAQQACIEDAANSLVQ
ncbi:hypothetical protein CATRI_07550 [Corynebacterium atrinae]|uniref:hypothetical protein n=1 Tax=Corynebacterium atrinae TaxID=1336740 RepID=UPI0025B5A2B5|nr:hypothetical protein [Corynebacterium atrinae]WJY63582.1 hypothetical protein CATRI_07550 [Corynebacterium atrinae]